MVTWTTKKIGEIATEKRVAYMPFSSEHLPYLGLEHIEQQSLRLSGIGDSAEAGSQKKRFKNGEILYGSLRPYFRKVYRPKFEGVCSTDITVLSAKDGNLNAYLFYLIANTEFIEKASNSSNGTKMPRAGWNIVKDFEFKIPDLTTQSCIATVLSAYDDLIENNEKRIKALEEMSQLLYTEWFVKFKFPGHEKAKMVDSGTEYGMIPEGWEVKRLDEVIRIVRGRSYSSEQISDTVGDYYMVNLKSFNRGGGFRVEGVKYYSGQISNDQLLKQGDIVVAVTDMTNDRAVIARPARIPEITTHKTTLSADVVKIASDKAPSSFIYYCLLDHRFTEATKHKANGANVLHLKPTAIEEYRALIPSIQLLHAFDTLCKPSFDLIDKIMQQNADLEKMRDLLTPQLVTGKRELK